MILGIGLYSAITATFTSFLITGIGRRGWLTSSNASLPSTLTVG